MLELAAIRDTVAQSLPADTDYRAQPEAAAWDRVLAVAGVPARERRAPRRTTARAPYARAASPACTPK